ncbi:MAG: hypothetical protein IJ930_08695 [Lachnospiraceae bacterium]|nr:hypothetical protein [Lachnospiraceae bacterium]
MDNFTFYSPAYFVFGKETEEDIPELVRVLCYGNGRNGVIDGFVRLDAEDCEKIYRLMI